MNSIINKLAVFTFVALVSFAVSSTAFAAQKIAIVNVKMIVDQSLASKNINKQIEKKREKFQAEVTKEEETLREEDQDLAKQRTVLSKEAFEQRAKEFRSKVIGAQKLVQSRRSQLEKAFVKAMEKVRKETIEIIEEISSKNDYAIALPKSISLYNENSFDISEEVLDELNDRLPEVDVVIEDK